MIRTLIVDDEHLVRKGLILTLPWAENGFEIVGEADNGETALDMIGKKRVDLLMTDLTMPVMDGFELMKRVKDKHPNVWTVVLTCHQDFHFLQDALRMGAIDYVVKTNLEDDALEEMLKRIAGRISAETVLRSQGLGGQAGPASSGRQAVIIMGSVRPDMNTVQAAIPLQENIWLYKDLSELEAENLLRNFHKWPLSEAQIACVYDWEPRTKASVWLDTLKNKLFYELDDTSDVLHVSFEEIKQEVRPDPVIGSRLMLSWKSLRWVFSDEEYYKLFRQLQQAQFPPSELCTLFERMAEAWGLLACLHGPDTEPRKLSGGYASFAQWDRWFSAARRRLVRYAATLSCSNDVFLSVLRAIVIMHEEVGESANRAELSSRVNLSQGYFSTVFKEIVGCSFHEVIKEIRLEKAKQILVEHTDMPVYWVAEQTGFQDEKYFSKIFRLKNGVVPSEYRERHAKR